MKNILQKTCSFTGFVIHHKWFIFIRVVDSSRPQAYFDIVSICILRAKIQWSQTVKKRKKINGRCTDTKKACRRRTDSTVLLKLKSESTGSKTFSKFLKDVLSCSCHFGVSVFVFYGFLSGLVFCFLLLLTSLVFPPDTWTVLFPSPVSLLFLPPSAPHPLVCLVCI